MGRVIGLSDIFSSCIFIFGGNLHGVMKLAINLEDIVFDRVVVLSFRYLKRKINICHDCELALYHEKLQSQVNIFVCDYDAP